MRKLLIAAVATCLTLASLEVAARLYMPRVAPAQFADGYYLNTLPLITADIQTVRHRESWTPDDLLDEDKAPDELRIAILGESSVEGAPFDANVSLAKMLHDRVRAALPDRRVTLLNMGRTASISTNVYYYLLAIARYEPDYIVFYMGMNDQDAMPGEQCMLAERPRLHGAWRTVVERSWGAWLARVYGPRMLWSSPLERGDSEDWASSHCSLPSFALWTDLLLEAARATGAEVVLATPARSAAAGFEPVIVDQRAPEARPDFPDRYRGLVACRLTDGCDYVSLLRDELNASGEMAEYVDHHARKAAAWTEAAARHDAEVVEFHRALEEASPGGLIGTAFFADWLRMLPDGYMYLAKLLSERIVASHEGREPAPMGPPTDAELAPYVDALQVTGGPSTMNQFQRGYFLTAVPLLEFIVDRFGEGSCNDEHLCDQAVLARVMLGWLRTQVGLEHGLPPDLAERAQRFDPRRSFDEMLRLATGD